VKRRSTTTSSPLDSPAESPVLVSLHPHDHTDKEEEGKETENGVSAQDSEEESEGEA
jgi:hypothetical protein